MNEIQEIKKTIESFRKTLLLLTVEANWSTEQIVNYLGCTEEEINFLRLLK